MARCKKPSVAAFAEKEGGSMRVLDFLTSKGSVPNQATTPLSRAAEGKGALFLCGPPLAGTVYAASSLGGRPTMGLFSVEACG